MRRLRRSLLCVSLFLAALQLGGTTVLGQAEPVGPPVLAQLPATGEIITLPQPARWVRCPAGKWWTPNGVDEVYRIENGFHGQALTGTENLTPVYTQQFQTTWPRFQRFSMEALGNGRYRIYMVAASGEKLYLATKGGKPRRGVLEVQEVEVYGKRPGSQTEELLTREAKVALSSQYGGYKPEFAIDGKADTFAHTQEEVHPWIEVRLPEASTISRINLRVRRWFCWRLRGAVVKILDADGREVWRTRLVGSRALYRIDLPHPVVGQVIRIEHDFGSENARYVYATPGAGGPDKIWTIEKVAPEGFYKIVHAPDGLCLQAPKTPGPDMRVESHVPVRLTKWAEDDRTLLWTIEPVRDGEIDCLAISQIGWTPQAPKFAMLVRRKKLAAEPVWVVTEPAGQGKRRVVMAGRAQYRGEAFTLHCYYIDLSRLQREGDFWLDCDGDRVAVHIAEDAYVRARHRCGTDVTYLREILDPNIGFVGHWAHLDNWCPGAAAFDEPYWMVKDYKTGQTKFLEPRRRIDDKYVAGWDHTDRQWNALQPSASLLRHLVFAWEISIDPEFGRDAKLTDAILREIIYGARYFIETQNPDGSWPVHTNIANKFTGTVAAVAGALAAAVPAVKTKDPLLAEAMLSAAKRGWAWVRANPDKWVPVPVSYRHGRAEEEMMLGVELGLVAGRKDCLRRAYDMVLAARIDPRNGAWVKQQGAFAGQAIDDRGTAQALITLMRHYSRVPEDVKAAIRRQVASYYAYLTRPQFLGRVWRVYEGQIGGYGPNSTWVRRACFLYRAFRFGGHKYAEGYLLAERLMDWVLGANPYATSCVFGFGDVFAVPGYLRAYEIGSLVPGLAVLHKNGAPVQPPRLTTCQQGYGNMESEAEAGVVFMEAMMLRHVLRDNPPS